MIKQIKTFFSQHSRWLILLLLFSFILNFWGIHWGLPDYRGWAPDEVTPSNVLNGIRHHFSNGWFELYPPIQYYLLASCYLPVYLLDLCGLMDFNSYFSYTLFFFLGRFISVLMGTGVILICYLIAGELFSRRTALLVALFLALNPSFVYYSKIANTDVPYLFWFSLSLLFYVRLFKYHHQLNHYLFFAATAALSVCTKDMAYGLYVLPLIPIFVSLSAEYRRNSSQAPFYRIIFDRRILLAFLTGVSIFLLVHNVFFNFEGFLNHLRKITGPDVELFREYPNSLRGHILMFVKAVRHLRFAMGWPFFLISCAGLFLSVFTKGKKSVLNIFWVFIASYYLFVFVVLRYHYVRFFLPLSLVFGFYGGLFIDILSRRERYSKIIYPAFLITAVYPLLMSISVNLSMTFDSRIHIEKWLNRHIRPGETTAFIGWKEYLPRKGDLEGEYIRDATVDSLKAFSPDYIVINERTCKCDGIEQALLEGSLNYRPFYRYHKNPWPVSWLLNQIYRDGKKQISTNLAKINPPIAVFKRIELGTQR